MKEKHIEGLVSIITPVYKAQETILACIESVLAQTYSNWEMILVDDCSPDESSLIVESIKDKRIKLIKNVKNLGPASTRNVGLSESRGQYIAFLDSDDFWSREKLDKQIKMLSASNYPMICSSIIHVKDGVEIRRISLQKKLLSFHDLLHTNDIVTSSVIINRHITGEFKMLNYYYDDFVCWLTITRDFGSCIVAQDHLLYYRILEGSVSRNKLKSAKKVYEIYRNFLNFGRIKTWYFMFFYAVNGVKKYI